MDVLGLCCGIFTHFYLSSIICAILPNPLLSFFAYSSFSLFAKLKNISVSTWLLFIKSLKLIFKCLQQLYISIYNPSRGYLKKYKALRIKDSEHIITLNSFIGIPWNKSTSVSNDSLAIYSIAIKSLALRLDFNLSLISGVTSISLNLLNPENQSITGMLSSILNDIGYSKVSTAPFFNSY